MNKLVSWIVIFFVLMAMSAVFVAAVECTPVPTDGCVVTQSTTFVPATYNLPNGIEILADNVVLDCNGSQINGSFGGGFPPPGINLFSGRSNVTVRNCSITNYQPGNGINGNDMEDSIFEHNFFTGDGAGMFFNGSGNERIVIRHNTFTNLSAPIGIIANNSIIVNNTFIGEMVVTIGIIAGSNNLIEDNIITPKITFIVPEIFLTIAFDRFVANTTLRNNIIENTIIRDFGANTTWERNTFNNSRLSLEVLSQGALVVDNTFQNSDIRTYRGHRKPHY